MQDQRHVFIIKFLMKISALNVHDMHSSNFRLSRKSRIVIHTIGEGMVSE